MSFDANLNMENYDINSDMNFLNDLLGLSIVNDLNREINSEEYDEDITHVKIPKDATKGFVFYPSHLKSYALLKQADSKLALLFLEDLISYGVTGQHITNNLFIRCLMENIAPVLDKSYAKYLEYCARDKHRIDFYSHPEDRIHASLTQLVNDTPSINSPVKE